MNLTMKYFTLICVLFIRFTNLTAQVINTNQENVISDIMEKLIENTESTIDYTDLQDQIEYLLQHRLNINSATRQDFQKLFFINNQVIEAIIAHRKEFGEYLSLYELQSIENIDENTLYQLTFFLMIEDETYTKNGSIFKMICEGKHEVFFLHENEFEQREGYDKSLIKKGKEYYLGNPYRYVLKYKFNSIKGLTFGFTGEKDMGEQFFKGAQSPGFDFNSAHFFLKNHYHFKAIAIGDYQASFGQGLTFGSGLSARKSSYVMNVRKNSECIRPYHSLNENEFLRGFAFTRQIKKMELTGVFSYKYVSTNYRDIDTLSQFDQSFSSIQLSGLHRTATEILNKNNVLQGIYGGHLKYVGRNYDVGITFINTFYDQLFLPGSKPYQLYNFTGKQLTNSGINYNFYLRNINFFGEVSNSSNDAFAVVSGLTIPLHQTLDLALLYRNYSKNFQTTFNNPFAENSDGRNEEGFYTALTFSPSMNWIVNTYFDIYRSPWLRYLVDAPSHGVDLFSEVQFNPSKSTQFYLRIKKEVKNVNAPPSSELTNYLIDASKSTIRINANYKVSSNLSAVSRIEMVQYQNSIIGTKNGTIIFQDLVYTTEEKGLSIVGRIALFSIEDYNARVYATETDVLNQYSVPLYQNSGVRYYFVVHYRFSKKLDAWLKYSNTTYNNVNTIGTGLQQINGNVLSDLRVQIRWSL